MVRLGNGYSSNIKTNYDPFNIKPFVLSLNLGQEETVLQFDEKGNLKFNGQVATVLSDDEDNGSEI